jgi:hypothetical protein
VAQADLVHLLRFFSMVLIMETIMKFIKVCIATIMGQVDDSEAQLCSLLQLHNL